MELLDIIGKAIAIAGSPYLRARGSASTILNGQWHGQLFAEDGREFECWLFLYVNDDRHSAYLYYEHEGQEARKNNFPGNIVRSPGVDKLCEWNASWLPRGDVAKDPKPFSDPAPSKITTLIWPRRMGWRPKFQNMIDGDNSRNRRYEWDAVVDRGWLRWGKKMKVRVRAIIDEKVEVQFEGSLERVF